MKGFAAFIMTGLPQAVVAALGFALGSLLFPPLGIFSGGILALVALRRGASSAVSLMAILVAALVILSIVLGQPASLGLLFGLIQWAPVLLLALLLRSTGSWQIVFQASLIVTAVVLLLVHASSADLPGYWLGMLENHVRPLLEQAGMDSQSIARDLPQMAQIMTGVLAVSIVLSTMLMLMLGRAMQASLYNPGGFADEFAELRFGLWPAGLAILLVAAAAMLRQAVVGEVLMVVMVLFFFQGLAVMHGLSRKLKWPAGIMVMLYVMLVLFFTPFALMLAVTGMVDAFVDMRKRIKNQTN